MAAQSKAYSVQKALREIKESGEAVVDVTIRDLVVNEVREIGLEPLCFPMSSHSFLIMLQEDPHDEEDGDPYEGIIESPAGRIGFVDGVK